MDIFSGLQPAALWNYFAEICTIPRLSKDEGRIIKYLLAFARAQKLEHSRDATGNVLIRKPASQGKEDLKTTILQSHLDMVGEKDQASPHDFTRDPIKPVRDGTWIRAAGTTLGADDGIGIAAQMLVLSDRTLEHGPLECLFTADEESGMTGAKGLNPGFMKGRILLNLDSEDWGELFIGCAGGIDTLGEFAFNSREPDKYSMACRISVSGLRGGHSGDEIHKSPGNAIKIAASLLLKAGIEHGLALSLFEGGNLRNAIPREAMAEFCIPGDQFQGFARSFTAEKTRISSELSEYEPDLKIELAETARPAAVLREKDQKRFLEALDRCPHGVIRWSPDIDDLVETSTNLASVRFMPEDKIQVVTSQRSSVEKAKKEIAGTVARCFQDGGAVTEHTDGYPGWTPDTGSEILGIVSETYEELFSEKPVVKAIHAGLECGLILEKYPGLDMVSFGPTIKGAHTPGERLDIESTEKFWRLLIHVLGRIPPAD
jgi:dipeptidase D